MQKHEESVFYFEIKGEIMEKIKDFFSDMKSEIKRIRWNKGKDLWKNVLVTLITIVFFALFFMLIQYIIVLVKMIDFHSIVETIKGWF
jgi:preprotein translocase subunit SecE